MAVMLSELLNDPRKYRIDGVFFKRVWKMAVPYWTRKDAWKSWLSLGVLVLMMAGFSASGGYFSYLTADLTNALVEHKTHVYWSLLIWITAMGLIRFAATLGQQLLSALLNQHWWLWLTTYLMDNYLASRTYYEIVQDDKIDNPDQRIQQEVEPFCTTISTMPQMLIGSLMDMGIQAGILSAISPTMLISVVIFAILQTLFTWLIYRPTIKQNFDVTVSEADLRYGLTHVRLNAENIAFYQGETSEQQHLLIRLKNAVTKNLRVLVYSIYIQIANEGVNQIWTYLPLIILVPLYFHGSIDYGTIAQATASAAMLLSSLSIVMNYIPQLSQAVPNVIRLAEIHEKFVEMANNKPDPKQQIIIRNGESIVLNHIHLQTPGGEQALVKDLSLSLPAGSRWVVVGRTGIGKSSLLRAMAGLWTRGSGEIELPADEQGCLFLPQRPYTFNSSLRNQLCYPDIDSPLEDAHLITVLQQVALGDLLDKHGDLDTEKDWARVLSLGEQQRIAFARVILRQPRYVFLDEATSALDVATEEQLYTLLAERNISYISIGHRDSLLHFHDQALRLLGDGKWEILPAASLKLDPTETEIS